MRAVTAINPLEVGRVWPKVEPLVGAALAHGDGGHAPVDVLDAIRERKAILWLGLLDGTPEMVAVTEVVQQPRRRFARMFVLGGENVSAWLADGMPALDEWARAEGCAEWEMGGRKGWLRRLLGWRDGGVVMRRALV